MTIGRLHHIVEPSGFEQLHVEEGGNLTKEESLKLSDKRLGSCLLLILEGL